MKSFYQNNLIAAVATIAAMSADVSQAQLLLEEVIVTAQKREQNLQDVSLSVSAFQGDTLRALGVSEVKDLSNLSANVDIKSSTLGVNPVVTVRGVGLNNFNSNNNPSVGIYVDEVFLSSPAMLDLFVMDLERIEVLKGPQGTLYGRNSSGGAINIHSAKPTQDLSGFAELSVGDFETTKFEGAIGGGLSDSVAGRVSLLYDRQGESFYVNSLTGEDLGESETFGIRGQLSFELDNLTSNLGLFYFEEDRVAGIPTIVGIRDPDTGFPVADPFFGFPLGNLFFDPCPVAVGAGGQNVGTGQCVAQGGFSDSNPDPFENDIDPAFIDRERIDSDVLGATFKVEYDFDNGMTLTSITGYMTQDRQSANGNPGIIFFEIAEDITQISQELRLSGEADFGTWVVGLNYSKDEFESASPFQSPNVLAPLTASLFGGSTNPFLTVVDQDTTVYAAFGNLDWNISDTLTLSAGLRFTTEEVEFSGYTRAFFNGLPGGPTDNLDVFANLSFLTSDAAVDPVTGVGFDLSNLTQTLEEDKVLGRVALEYRPDDAWLIYGSISTGFKSGGFNGDFAFSNAEIGPFDPETIVAYEIGSKSTLFDGLAQLNAAVFLYDYEDIQTFVPGPAGVVFTNAEQADIFGLDLELLANPAEGLDVSFGLGWLDTEISDPSPADFVNFVTVPGLTLDGNQLPNSPELQVTGLVRYEFAVSDALSLSLQGDFKWTDSKFTEAFNDPANVVDEYIVANARIGLGPADGQWELSIWSRNVFDEEYFTESIGFSTPAAIFNFAGAPRTFGVTLNWNI